MSFPLPPLAEHLIRRGRLRVARSSQKDTNQSNLVPLVLALRELGEDWELMVMKTSIYCCTVETRLNYSKEMLVMSHEGEFFDLRNKGLDRIMLSYAMGRHPGVFASQFSIKVDTPPVPTLYIPPVNAQVSNLVALGRLFLANQQAAQLGRGALAPHRPPSPGRRF